MGFYSNSSKKYVAFRLDIPPEYYCKVNDILNEFMDRFNMSEGDVLKLSDLMVAKNREFMENFPDSMENNFFSELIMRRNNGVRAAKDFVDDTLRSY